MSASDPSGLKFHWGIISISDSGGLGYDGKPTDENGNRVGLIKFGFIPDPETGTVSTLGGYGMLSPGEFGSALAAGVSNLIEGASLGLIQNSKYHNVPGAVQSRVSGGVAMAAVVGIGAAAGVAWIGAIRATQALVAAGTTLATRCFVAGTPVQMADGTTKAIELIRSGDLVASRDQHAGADGRLVAARVVRSYQHQVDHTVAVTLSSGERIECTETHLFFVPGAGWVPAGRLSLGTQITPRAGPRVAGTILTAVTVAKVERNARARGVTTTVYNFEVEGAHTYFVGRSNGGTWVHNDCSDAALESLQAEGSGWIYRLTSALGPRTNLGINSWAYHDIHVTNGGLVNDSMQGISGMPLTQYMNQMPYPEVTNITPLSVNQVNGIISRPTPW